MLIQYQNTLDDFREASTAVGRANRKRKPITRVMGIAVWLVMWLILRQFISHLPPAEAAAAWIHLMLPIVAVIGFFNAMGFGAVLRGDVKFRFTRGMIIWPAILALVGLDLWLSHGLSDRLRIVASWPWSWRLLIPHTTWLLLLAGIGLTMIRSHFRSLQRNWDSQPNLRRPHTADIAADGVVISDSDSRLEYQWTAFARWQETPSLFLLVTGKDNYHMLPKRAFDSEEKMSAFRAMARAISGNRMIGFPVEAVAGRITPVAIAS